MVIRFQYQPYERNSAWQARRTTGRNNSMPVRERYRKSGFIWREKRIFLYILISSIANAPLKEGFSNQYFYDVSEDVMAGNVRGTKRRQNNQGRNPRPPPKPLGMLEFVTCLYLINNLFTLRSLLVLPVESRSRKTSRGQCWRTCKLYFSLLIFIILHSVALCSCSVLRSHAKGTSRFGTCTNITNWTLPKPVGPTWRSSRRSGKISFFKY